MLLKHSPTKTPRKLEEKKKGDSIFYEKQLLEKNLAPRALLKRNIKDRN